MSGQKAYYFRIDENGELVGGIAKFVQEHKEAVVKALGLKNGDFVALAAGDLKTAQKTAGVIRKAIGNSFDGYPCPGGRLVYRLGAGLPQNGGSRA